MDDREIDNSALKTLLKLIRKRHGKEMYEKHLKKPEPESNKEQAIAALVADKKGTSDGEG